MQYLSKAYNYYSGINPATLSGAIDVIVVRHVDSDGHVTLASSPFHVRFGKLQVLRAGEKRVTVKLPNNLPHPHVAPFSMKVGESGEAFFVLETTEDVPDELLTSPVVEASEPNPEPHTPPTRPAAPSTVVTKEPFGDTEAVKAHEDDVDFLDLNAGPNQRPGIESDEGSRSSSSSAQNFARPSRENSPRSPSLAQNLPPNPLDAPPGQSGDLPARDEKLAHLTGSWSSVNADALPRVPPGLGEAPSVLYGNDVVVDMAGYHNRRPVSQNQSDDEIEEDSTDVEAFIRDLRSAIEEPLVSRPLSPQETTTHSPKVGSTTKPSILLNQMTPPRRHDRVLSEPPPDPSSPNVQGAIFPRPLPSTAVMDYAWDWGTVPPQSVHPDDVDEIEAQRRGRSDSLPPAYAIKSTATLQSEGEYLLSVTGTARHLFEVALCAEPEPDFASFNSISPEMEQMFIRDRVTYSQFMKDPDLLGNPQAVVQYGLKYYTWTSAPDLLQALLSFRRSLNSTHPTQMPVPHSPSGSSWTRWWRREPGQPGIARPDAPTSDATQPSSSSTSTAEIKASGISSTALNTQYVKTLRLSSEQLLQLQLKPGPNTVQFSVTSSYSGLATCAARIFLWEHTDQIVISDIDGTITKSDALGHVFAAIGRDWTHLGIAKLYTDICNNGYKMLYLTSRAIGQADSTREYLKSIAQSEYRLPEGPVIMSPDRLMASLHREVIMRKPELFKMACLRDIQRLFASKANEAFYAGFGNRITDAMSYRSVGVMTSKIYTIDSTGVVRTELLQSAGHKGSYVGLNDLVNEVFPPAKTKVKPEFTDFNYWRSSLPEVDLPDLAPPSPTLSARSDSSSRYSVLGKITSIGRRSSRQNMDAALAISRPSSPLIEPAATPEELSEEETGAEPTFANNGQVDEIFDDDADFDDDILATGEMKNVPF